MSLSHEAPSPLEIPSREGPPYAPVRRILGEFALAWVRHALRAGVSPAVEEAPGLAFLDPFAGVDHPASPPLSARALGAIARLAGRRGPGAVRAWLWDEDPVKVEWVRAALSGVTLGPEAAAEAGVLAVETREGTLPGAGDLPAALREAGAALVLLDPPGAGRIPPGALTSLLGGGAADVLLRFPVGDLRRLSRHHGSPLADLPPFARRQVEGVSGLLGDARHGWVFAWTATLAERGAEAAEREVVDALARRMGEVGGITARVVAVPPAVPGDGPEYLLLATRAPERALLINEVLFAARQAGWLGWPDDSDAGLVRYARRGELELFAGAGAGRAGAVRDRVVDGVALAHEIATIFAGRTVPLDAVLAALLDRDVFLDDARRALAELRRDGRALYRSLASGDAEIAFPRRRTARNRTTRRGRRGPGPQESLSLVLDPENE